MSFNPDYIAKYRESDVKDGHVDSNGLLNFENRGLPPVTGSGKALVSVDGEWVEQSGFPYEESGETVIVDNETVVTTDMSGSIIGLFAEYLPLVAGKTYNVTYDGEQYNGLIAQAHSEPGMPAVVVIIGAAAGGAVFSITQTEDSYQSLSGALATLSEPSSHTVTIKEVSSTIHTIDPKYLPVGGFGYEESGDVEEITNESVTTEKSSPYIPYAFENFEEAFSLILGRHYSVTIDANTYHAVASSDLLLGVTLGATATLEGFDFSEYPFIIACSEDELPLLITETAGTYNVKIETAASTIHTIDPKYLPPESKLPEVTSEDDGKFMRVENGEWAAVKNNTLSSVLTWGKETHGLIGTTGVTLPEVVDTTVVNEITYTFTATAAAYSFTAPDEYILGDDDGFAGLSAGNTLAYTNLTVGSVYETSFKVIDAMHIALVMKEWKTE